MLSHHFLNGIMPNL